MTNPLEHWRTDPEKEVRGAWVELGGGVAFLVTRMGGQNMEALAELARLPDLVENPTAKQTHEHNALALASVFVKDWRGMDEPFTPEGCHAKLLELTDLVLHLKGVVLDRATFRPAGGTGAADDRALASVDGGDGAGGAAREDGGGEGTGASEPARGAAPYVNGHSGDRVLSPDS